MQLNFKARDWHNWASIILAVPLLLVGLTAIFLAHKKELQLNDIDLGRSVSWLPGYRKTPMVQDYNDIRSSLIDEKGQQWVGTQNGLYRIVDGKAEAVRELGDAPIRDLVKTPWGILAATKYGIWIKGDAGWQRHLKGDAWNANLNPDGHVAVSIKDKGLLISSDGETWAPQRQASDALAALPTGERMEEKINLGKLMIDLHTGKAFFSKAWEWIWIDLLGAIWAFLGFTGTYMWWRSQTKRRDAARGKLPKEMRHG